MDKKHKTVKEILKWIFIGKGIDSYKDDKIKHPIKHINKNDNFSLNKIQETEKNDSPSYRGSFFIEDFFDFLSEKPDTLFLFIIRELILLLFSAIICCLVCYFLTFIITHITIQKNRLISNIASFILSCIISLGGKALKSSGWIFGGIGGYVLYIFTIDIFFD